MAEPLHRTPSPAIGIDRAGVTLAVEHDLALAKVQTLGDAAGPAAGKQEHAGGLTRAWMAPNEWLLIGPQAIVATAMAAATGDDALVVDLTHGRTAFLLSGAEARDALAAHCPLDLWPATFPVDAVARTLLGDTSMFIARLADGADGPCFRIIVDQTMAAYAARMLAGPVRSGETS